MTKQIKFGNIVIGELERVVVIAEAACEHQGSLESAKRLVELAKNAGADIVKFQLHLPEEEMLPRSIGFWAGSMDEVLERVNLPPEAHVELMQYCDQVGIQYLCTPFCAKAADVLQELGVQAFKIGSGEMTNIPMIRHIARKGKPMLVSTGMATLEEIRETVEVLKGGGVELVLMNCTSAYPPRYDEVSLGFIPRMREMFDVLIGHSDHTTDIWVPLGAVALGARVIEKHFTSDHSLKGPDHFISLDPVEFQHMVEGIRHLEGALGTDKRVTSSEEEVRRWAHHSVVSLRDIPAGTVISPVMVGVKRPGWGIPAKRLEEIFGRVAARNIRANSLLQWEDLSDHAV